MDPQSLTYYCVLEILECDILRIYGHYTVATFLQLPVASLLIILCATGREFIVLIHHLKKDLDGKYTFSLYLTNVIRTVNYSLICFGVLQNFPIYEFNAINYK